AHLVDRLAPLFFDASVDSLVTSKTPGAGRDILEASANNLYADVTMEDLEGFEEQYALNSRLVKRPPSHGHDGTGATDGPGSRLVEEPYRVGGRYDREIRR